MSRNILELTHTHIDEIFEAFGKTKVLVVGDAMLDVYTEGMVNRTSPEAPVPVVDVVCRHNKAGGASNVACNIKSLGATPILCTIIGNDKAGNDLIGILAKQDIDTAHVITSDSRPTTTKERVICDGKHLIRIDEETKDDLNESEYDTISSHIADILNSNRIKAIILQDYDKGVLTPRLIRHIIVIAQHLDIPVMVDPKKKHFGDYENVFLFKPNAKELCESTDAQFSDIGSIIKASQNLCQTKGHNFVMTTLSERGAIITDSTDSHHLDAIPRNVVDVSGAGDTVISTAALCLAVGETALNTAFIANIAGGIVCEEKGVVPIDREKLINETKRLLVP